MGKGLIPNSIIPALKKKLSTAAASPAPQKANHHGVVPAPNAGSELRGHVSTPPSLEGKK